MTSFSAPSYSVVGDSAIAWVHFYKRNGQEWWLVELDDNDFFGMKYNGEFRMGFFKPQMLRMVPDIILDVKWMPKTLSAIKQRHICCESPSAMRKRVNYAQEMESRY